MDRRGWRGVARGLRDARQCGKTLCPCLVEVRDRHVLRVDELSADYTAHRTRVETTDVPGTDRPTLTVTRRYSRVRLYHASVPLVDRRRGLRDP